eukprot:GFYU01007335.1.p1 GENE.GFYU01007335.1~~GFYU01007335.1.p1  ORF type:complete len:439 (-),score=120.57 GFYU01007335.1:163-1479(-)
MFFIIQGPIILHKQKLASTKGLMNKVKEKTKMLSNITGIKRRRLTIMNDHVPVKRKLEGKHDPWMAVLPPVPTISAPISPRTVFIQLLSSSVMPYYMIVYLVISVVGQAVSPFWFTFHLLDYVRFPAGLMVLESIRRGGYGIFKTAILGTIFMFVCSVFAFRFYAEQLPQTCDTFFQCAMSHVGAGFMDGRLENVYNDVFIQIPESIDVDLNSHVRVLVMFFYSITWSILLLNVVLGQIFDGFADIRAQKNQRQNDLKERCFICSVDRITFEQQGNGFHDHVSDDHDPLAYLYFLQHLQEGAEIDFDGVESYVWKKAKNNDGSFFPVGSALCLRVVGKNTLDDKMDDLTLSLSDRLGTMEDDIKELKRIVTDCTISHSEMSNTVSRERRKQSVTLDAIPTTLPTDDDFHHIPPPGSVSRPSSSMKITSFSKPLVKLGI